MAKITLNVNNEIIDEYIEHVKYLTSSLTRGMRVKSPLPMTSE